MKDKICDILSKNITHGHESGGLVSVKRFGAVADEIVGMIEAELTEARAEIERLRARNAILDNAIAEMTEEQSALCAEGQTITELVAAKNKLIEQMREEISRLKRCCNLYSRAIGG